jgi:uncharacterized phage protein (TIGR01671 family)
MSHREIKFRVWDKKSIVFKGFYNLWEWADLMASCLTFPLSDYVFQQYTGLKDKNSKEIYEGDIIKDKQGLLWNVFFNNEYGNFDMDSNMLETKNYFTRIHEKKYIEIIGNIFENSELLEDYKGKKDNKE